MTGPLLIHERVDVAAGLLAYVAAGAPRDRGLSDFIIRWDPDEEPTPALDKEAVTAYLRTQAALWERKEYSPRKSAKTERKT